VLLLANRRWRARREPIAGDTLERDGRTVVVQGTPILDAEGLVYTVDTRPL
jgi:hypothetical protein